MDEIDQEMDLGIGAEVQEIRRRINDFLNEHVYPREAELLELIDRETAPGKAYPDALVEIREQARQAGLWNLFLPDSEFGPGLTNVQYGALCEVMGRSPALVPQVFNCAAPDTGNMEILAEHGSPEQQDRWLQPMLEGRSRSAFSMTEPDTSGSDPVGLKTRAELDGDEWVINGHKWFTTGAVGADFVIVMAVTDPEADRHRRASMIIVPIDAEGLELVRSVSVMGEVGGPGHCELRYENCRVPAENLLGARQEGFTIAQDRLGPGRIHHCMRAIGTAERALELMCRYSLERESFGGPLADKQFIQEFIARSRIEIEQARMLTMKAAWMMDKFGKSSARQEISMIKIVAANVVMKVLDRAIQVHGALGVSDDTPLAHLWRWSRMLRIADGPDEVHKAVVARRELRRWRSV